MRKHYFIVVVGHSVHGRLRRLRIPGYAVHLALALALFGSIAGIGFVSSYARMFNKVGQFNQIRTEKAALEKRYAELQQHSDERDAQLASLGSLASEVSIAFGIKRQGDNSSSGSDWPTAVKSPANQFDFLQSVRLPARGDGAMWAYLENTTPSIWPVKGRINSSFGSRLDPFLGKGAFHSGVDLSASTGTAVVATADGTVTAAGWGGGYGRRIMIAHGRNGLATHYAHMTDLYVQAGQVVRRGEVIGRVGSTGRTQGNNLHYEVRSNGTPVNPYKFLGSRSSNAIQLAFSD